MVGRDARHTDGPNFGKDSWGYVFLAPNAVLAYGPLSWFMHYDPDQLAA